MTLIMFWNFGYYLSPTKMSFSQRIYLSCTESFVFCIIRWSLPWVRVESRNRAVVSYHQRFRKTKQKKSYDLLSSRKNKWLMTTMATAMDYSSRAVVDDSGVERRKRQSWTFSRTTIIKWKKDGNCKVL